MSSPLPANLSDEEYQIGLDYVTFVIEGIDPQSTYGDIYNALSRAAGLRAFRGMGYSDLTQIGISFALGGTAHLYHLVDVAQQRLLAIRFA